jgi:hypothetical protein
MAQATTLILVGITSMGALLIGTRCLRLRGADLGIAAGKMLGCVGAIIAFFATNLAVGLLVIIVGRSLTGVFVSTYAMSDVGLLGLSCLQGLFFHCWWEASKGGRGTESGRGAGAQRRRGDGVRG